jgi:transposase
MRGWGCEKRRAVQLCELRSAGSLLLQAFYSVRSELQLMEQLDYNLLFRWLVGLSLDAAVWDETVFTKNCKA